MGDVLLFGELVQPVGAAFLVGYNLNSSMSGRLRRRYCPAISARRSEYFDCNAGPSRCFRGSDQPRDKMSAIVPNRHAIPITTIQRGLRIACVLAATASFAAARTSVVPRRPTVGVALAAELAEDQRKDHRPQVLSAPATPISR